MVRNITVRDANGRIVAENVDVTALEANQKKSNSRWERQQILNMLKDVKAQRWIGRV